MADELNPRRSYARDPYAGGSVTDGGDRLPWLETVEPDEQQGPGIGRIVALVLLGLVVVAGVAFAAFRLQQPDASGDGQLIVAEAGAYKVRPDEPGGLKVKGEGDSAIATSAGKGAGNGAIDLRAVPEAPVAETRPAAAAPTTAATPGRTATAAVPRTGGRLVAAAPLTGSRPARADAAGGGTLVQLGAYPSEGIANSSWDRFARRFGYLAALDKVVQPVASGGRTLYRLRVNAGSANQAADLCGRLRVAGETCFVAS